MENKENLKKDIVTFRDRLKKYRSVCIKFLNDIRANRADAVKRGKKREEKLREELTEEWGRLAGVFQRINAPITTVSPSIGYPVHFFDEALSANFQNPHKFDGLGNAISSATKAIGMIDALTEADYRKLHQRPHPPHQKTA